MLGIWSRYWFGYSVSFESLVLFRFLFYLAFAYDMWLQVPRAHKFDQMSEFNVPHAAFLPTDRVLAWLAATTTSLARGMVQIGVADVAVVFWLLQSAVAFRIAVNAARRWESMLLLPLLNGVVYWSSQLDNFQHHFLLFVTVTILGSINWRELPAASAPFGSKGVYVHCWQLRLLFAVLAQTYFWTVVVKLHPAFLSGAMLPRVVSPTMNLVVERIKDAVGISLWQPACVSVVVAEVVLAVVLAAHTPQTGTTIRVLTAVSGSLLHVGLGSGGLRIGLFSTYMTLFYLPLFPLVKCFPVASAVISFFAAPPGASVAQEKRKNGTMASAIYAGIATVATLAALTTVPLSLPVMTGTAILTGIILFFALWRAALHQIATSLAHVTWALALLYLHLNTAVVRETYEGFAHNGIRAGDSGVALKYFKLAIEADPYAADTRADIGLLLAGLHRPEEAQYYFSAALEADPSNVKAHVGSTMYYASKEDSDRTCRKAAAALQAVTQASEALCDGESCEHTKVFAKGFGQRQLQRITSVHRCEL